MYATVSNNRQFQRISLAGRAAATSAIALCAISFPGAATLAFADKTPQIGQDQGQPTTPKLRLRIAVDQFKWNEIRDNNSLPSDVKEGLQALLIERLQKSERFQVMEREATAQQQANQEDDIDRKKREGAPEGTAASAVRPRQRRTAAEFLLTPTVVGFQETGGGGQVFKTPFGTVGGKKTQTTLAINIRISNAETSALVDTVTGEGRVETSSQKFSIEWGGLKFGDHGSKSAPLNRLVDAALASAVDKLVARLVTEPWRAFVAAQDLSTGRVIIAAGSEGGVSAGMVFAVNRTGQVVRDPETGDIISRGDETTIGHIRIVRVERSASYADVVDGSGFESGNIVREMR